MIEKIIYVFIAVLLISIDKIITVKSLELTKKYFPKRYITIEKNPLNRFFFKKFGIRKGAIIYSFTSLISFFLSVYFIGFLINSYFYSFLTICFVYVITIGNNLYWLNKYRRYKWRNGVLRKR